MANTNLSNAKKAKKDEFYTQYADIEKELMNYSEQLKNKVVYCNCDDPNKSNFVKYFTDNFNSFGLKKLVATHFVDPQTGMKPSKLVLTQSADGFISEITRLEGDGDFRSSECVSLLDEADVVVTNPPFSLWSVFADLLKTHNKSFIALGTIQAANYVPILEGICAGTVQAGYTNYNKALQFVIPEHYESKSIINGQKIAEVLVCWWTNLAITNRKPLELQKNYSPEFYPKYEAKNSKGKPVDYIVYDAINVDKVSEIPCDYYGLMGVPVTILGLIDHNQFEVVGKINNGFIGDRKVFTRIVIQRKTVTATVSASKKTNESISYSAFTTLKLGAKADVTKTDTMTAKQRESYNRFTSFMAEMIEKYGADVLAELEA